MKKLHKLSPSDFRYLWNDCKHCYYMKVVEGITLPSIGIPGIFMKMNSLLQDSIIGMNLSDINSDLPSGVIDIKEGFLRSIPVPITGDCYISGRFDILSRLDDGTYALVDFKITDPKEDQAAKFAQQLHAYKFALENPQGTFEPKKVSKMGLITVSPEAIQIVSGKVVFTSMPKWHPVEENMENFYNLISEISQVLNGSVPAPSQQCLWCRYREYFSSPVQKKIDDIPF